VELLFSILLHGWWLRIEGVIFSIEEGHGIVSSSSSKEEKALQQVARELILTNNSSIPLSD
jgi:hypothetical protein